VKWLKSQQQQKNSPPPLSWIKKVRRAEVAIFPCTEQVSDRIPTDRCNYRTKEIMRAESLNFAPKLKLSARNFAFLDNNSYDKYKVTQQPKM